MSSFLGFLGKKKKHETGDVQYRNLPEQIPSNVKRCEKVISEKHKFIWLFVPKVGGRSLKSVLIDSYGGYVAEKGMDELVNEKPEYATYFRFNFVRNPWSCSGLQFFGHSFALIRPLLTPGRSAPF
jgi:hypothetical protein